MQRVTTILFNAGRDRQRQRVKENIVSGNSVLCGCLLVSAFGDFKLSLGGARHSLLINSADYDAGAVSLRKIENLGKEGLAVFIIRRVEDAFAAGMLQARFHLLPFGGIEHQRNLDVRDEAGREFVHVFLAVAADEINVDVEHVRAFTFLLTRQ